jgi:translocation and assembly module TamB
MPQRQRRRRFLLGLGFALAMALAFWFSLPLWWPWVLAPLARHEGARYAQYEREGYNRFRLSGLSFTNEALRFRADHVEALVPTVWLWRAIVARPAQPVLNEDGRALPAPFLSVNGWEFQAIPTGKPAESVHAQAQSAAATLAGLRKWLPIAAVSNGTIRLPQATVAVPAMTWTQGLLSATLGLPQERGQIILRGDFSTSPTNELRLRADRWHLDSTFNLMLSPAGLDLQGVSSWWSNRVDLRAHFGTNDVLPESAGLHVARFRIPLAVLQIPYYPDITGSVSAEWRHGEFALDLTATARPLAAETSLPPLELALHARGDTNTATIQSASLSAPWFKAELSRDLQLYFTGSLLREPANLTLAADLARQPWFPLTGKLNGEAKFAPAGGKLPAVQFRLSGAELAIQSLKARALRLEGSFNWPQLGLSSSEVDFADDSLASITGTIDLEKLAVADGRARLRGPLVNRWLPPGYAYQDLSLAGEFSGALSNLVHTGRLDVTNLICPQVAPLQLRAHWTGQNLTLPHADVLVSAGHSSLLLGGALTNQSLKASLAGTNQPNAHPELAVQVNLATLTLTTNSRPALDLARPFLISLRRSPTNDLFHVTATAADWTGPGGELQARADINWPEQGDVRLAMANLSSGLFAAFAKTNLPEIEIGKLDASAGWSNGPAIFGLALTATVLAEAGLRPGDHQVRPTSSAHVEGVPVTAEIRLHGDGSGVTLSNLLVTSQNSAVASARGFLPLTLHPSETNLVRLEEQAPLDFAASVQPHTFLWDTVAEGTGLQLRQPHLNLKIGGTWQAAQGEVNLGVDQIRLRHATTNMPDLEDLSVVVQLDRRQARLTQGRILVQGQPVSLTGEIPLGEEIWAGLFQKKLPNWDTARIHLQVQAAQIAAFEPLLPQLLAPQGELNLDLSVLPGGKLDGELTVQDARTRPLAEAGPVRDIQVRVQFAERSLKLESASANVGGAALTLTGQADLSGTRWLAGDLPPFEFVLRGASVPLARKPEVIVRSDLLLSLTKTNAAPPVVSGTARLHDSYFLSDLSDLVPGKVAAPEQRPPYFSLDQPQLAAWRLAVDVEGNRFLKVRSPLFNGEISATVKLGGTLKDPMALGDLRVDSGTVNFPFASFQVQQGLVSLSSDDPYRPKILLNALSKQFGYDIRMQVSGTADSPVIEFTSTPPLSSGQILLMVTAGELPQGTYNLTPQQKAQTMGMFLGQDLLTKLGLAGQGQPRLIVHSGEEITEQGKPTYNVEIRLTPRWSLVGEYDRFGDYNGGVKWRIYSR